MLFLCVHLLSLSNVAALYGWSLSAQYSVVVKQAVVQASMDHPVAADSILCVTLSPSSPSASRRFITA